MSAEDRQFTDEKFMSASDKRKVLRAWIRFLQNGCKQTQFTADLYHHLSQHCSFIAHYDRHGFYSVYFERHTPETFRFLDQFDPQKSGISAEYGTTHWLSPSVTGSDLNAAMREAAGPFVDSLRRHFAEIHRQAEMAQVNRLLAKHGLIAVPAGDPTAPVTGCTAPPERVVPNVNLVQPQLFSE